jgi:hypothetical protein
LKTIVITGCSWGAGEWGKNSTGYALLHPGISQNFIEVGYNVVNLSQPGSDPYGLLFPLDAFLKVNIHLDIAYVFYIQTDISRVLNFKEIPFSESCNQSIKKEYLCLYEKLNHIAKTNNKKISVIGGLTDVDVKLTQFSSLELALQSWCRLIDPKAPLTTAIDIEYFTKIKSFKDQKTEIIQMIDRSVERRNLWESNPSFFWPDGLHPNRKGHQKLFDYLMKNYIV